MKLTILLTIVGIGFAELRQHNGSLRNSIPVRSDYKTKERAIQKGRSTYKPEWSDLDKRPLPKWYDQAKIGIFLHWGVYSVPSFTSEWFWMYWKDGNKNITDFMKKNYPPGFTYQQFAPMFTAEFFNPEAWAKLFKKAGIKYVVLTSKHHEGFTLFPSKRSFSWNSVEVGPHRDLVGDLAKAVRDEGLDFGVYHSLYEWFNPIYLQDKAANFTTCKYRDDKLWPDLKQLVHDYKPSVIWSDGDWEAEDTYWNSTVFLAWLYNDSPVRDYVVVNDRWGKDIPCHHGDFYNCKDRYHPGTLQNHKWENAFTLDKDSWAYRRQMNVNDVFTMEDLLLNIVSTVSCGGNALINIGPTKEGTIIPIFQERLLALGEWLDVNGEAIYGSSPWKHQNDTVNTNVWYTCSKVHYNWVRPTAKPSKLDTITAVYAIFLKWPQDNILRIGAIVMDLKKGIYRVELLGHNAKELEWKIVNGQAEIQLPQKSEVGTKYAWTLKFVPKN